jgi:hypothetical protein
MSAARNHVNYCDLQVGEALFHVKRGLCIVVRYQPRKKVLWVEFLNSMFGEYPEAAQCFGADLAGIFCNMASLCVGAPPAGWLVPTGFKPLQASTYRLQTQASSFASGSWPLTVMLPVHKQAVYNQAAQGQIALNAVIDALDGQRESMSFNSVTKPFACDYNAFFVITKLGLRRPSVFRSTPRHELGIAVRRFAGYCADTAGVPAPEQEIFVQTIVDDGYKNTLTLDHIEVAPDLVQGLAVMRHESGQTVSAYLTCFSEQAPYLASGLRYETRLSGVGWDVEPASAVTMNTQEHEQSDAMRRPTWEQTAQFEKDRLVHEATQPSHFTVIQTQAPCYQWAGYLAMAVHFRWEDSLQGLFGEEGYRLYIEIGHAQGKTKPFGICIYVQKSRMLANWQPRTGQMLRGQCWTQLWVDRGA